jgi:hypothetical protein
MMVRTCRYKMDATGRFSSKCFLEVRFLVADHGWQKVVRSRLTRQVFSTVWSDRAQSPCGARCLCKVEVWGREPAWWTSRFQSGEPEAAEILGARAFQENASPYRAQDHTQSHSSHDGELEAWVNIIAMFSLMVSLFALGLWLRQECHKLKLRKFRDCDLPGRYDSSTVL